MTGSLTEVNKDDVSESLILHDKAEAEEAPVEYMTMAADETLEDTANAVEKEDGAATWSLAYVNKDVVSESWSLQKKAFGQ